MLIYDFIQIGNRLLHFRKHAGMTQAEVAEAAGLSDRTYADIERGTVNMRIETVLRICDVFHITPNELLTDTEKTTALPEEILWVRLQNCPPKEKAMILRLLTVYLESLSE